MELQQPFGGHEEVIADTLRMKASKGQVEVLAAAAGLSDPQWTFHLQAFCCFRKATVFGAEVIVSWIFLLLEVKSILSESPTDVSGRMRSSTLIFPGEPVPLPSVPR